jgi:hypothetical protein
MTMHIPLYRLAKAYDYQIMRAIETHPNALSWPSIEIDFYIIVGLQCCVKTCTTTIVS